MRWHEDGSLVVTLRITPEHAVPVMERLDEETAAVQAEREAHVATLAAKAAVPTEPASAEVPEPPRTSAEVPTEPTSAEAARVWQDLLAAFPEGVPSNDVFVEPPYPFTVDTEYRLPKEQAIRLERAYREELELRRAKRDAWRAWQEHLAAEALKAHVPIGRATRADGFIRALTRHPDGASMVKVQLLIDPLSGWARTTDEELLPPRTVQAIVEQSANRPTLPRVRPLTEDDLLRHDQGRTSRVVTPALRALLGHLDGERCRIPSCSRKRKLHAHHVTYWRHGGRTDLANLILVCSRHHTLIHQYGWQLTLHDDRSLTVMTADGLPLPHRHPLPVAPAAELDPDETITPSTLPTRWSGERMDLDHVVWVMLQHAA